MRVALLEFSSLDRFRILWTAVHNKPSWLGNKPMCSRHKNNKFDA